MTKYISTVGLSFIIALLAIYSASAQSTRLKRTEHGTSLQRCQADCLDRTGQNGRPAPFQACRIRCGAVADFNQPRGAVTSQLRGEVTDQQRRAASGRPAIVLPQMPAAPNGYSVVYAARSPSSSFGMVVGNTDRLAAYRIAEQLCASSGAGCRMIGESTSMCGAVAQGIQRSRHALFITSDPSTFTVTSTSQGSAANRASAEQDAMAECASVDRQGTCRIVAAQCGPVVL
jgi:hypothetical protein